MSHFPIIRATFPDSSFTPHKIARRLFEYLLRLRAARAGTDLPYESGLGSSDYRRVDGPDLVLWTVDDRQRADRRARLLHECVRRKSGLGHLSRDDRDRLSILRDGVRLARIASEHQADELAARLHDEMPWMAPATEYAWHAMRRSVREGRPGFRLPPVILDGPPGIGKSPHCGSATGRCSVPPNWNRGRRSTESARQLSHTALTPTRLRHRRSRPIHAIETEKSS